jgi:hypothetical protein
MSAVNPLVQTTAQDALPRGDENHIPLVENPYAGTPNAPEYENGYQYAQTLGHQTLNQLSPDQVASWKTAPTSWREGFATAAEKLGVKTVADQLRGGPMKAANWSWTKLAESDEDEKEDEDDDEDEDDKKKKAVPWNFSKEAGEVHVLPNLPPTLVAERIRRLTKPINIQSEKPAKPVTANIVKAGEWNWQKTSGFLHALKPAMGAGIGALIPPLLGAGIGAGVGEVAHLGLDHLFTSAPDKHIPLGPSKSEVQAATQHMTELRQHQNALQEAAKANNIPIEGQLAPGKITLDAPQTWNISAQAPHDRFNWEAPLGAAIGGVAGMSFMPHGALIGGGIGALSSPRRRDPNLMPL